MDSKALYIWLSKILLSIYTINIQNKHTRKTSPYVVVHVKDDVETVLFTTAVHKPIWQQESEHTVLLHSHVENQQGKALTVSSHYLRCQSISYPADHKCCDGGNGIKCQVLLEEKKQNLFSPMLCIPLRCVSAVCCWGDDITRQPW